jgi:hypothetical protein
MPRAAQLALAGVVALVLCAVCGSTQAAKADSLASIRGYVTVESPGGPIEDARVVLRSPLQTIETHTDRQGFFSMIGVIPVPHASIAVSRLGFMSKEGDIPICTGATLRLAIKLPSFCTMMCFPHILVERTDYTVSGSTYVVNPEPYETTNWQGQC